MIRIVRRSLAGLALALAACAPCPVPQAVPLPPHEPFDLVRMEPAATTATPEEPADTVRIVEVEIHTTHEGASGKFAPEVVRARQGDVLRFRMVNGLAIHYVSFTAGQNDGRGIPLPADSPMLLEKGQSWQLRVDLPPGTYEFVCIPHGPLGMRGTLIVEE